MADELKWNNKKQNISDLFLNPRGILEKSAFICVFLVYYL